MKVEDSVCEVCQNWLGRTCTLLRSFSLCQIGFLIQNMNFEKAKSIGNTSGSLDFYTLSMIKSLQYSLTFNGANIVSETVID